MQTAEIRPAATTGDARSSYVAHLRGCRDCSDPAPSRQRCATGQMLRARWIEESQARFGAPAVLRTWPLDVAVG